MSKFARMIEVLDLFSTAHITLSAEEVAERLQISRPTAFRYVRELTAAGFLANTSGRYELGPRVITLDYLIRETDPLLRAAEGPMQQLAAETSHGVILCRMYNDAIINVHKETGYDRRAVSFGRGREMPLFRGAGSKVLVAAQNARRLRRLHDLYGNHPDVQAFAPNWPAFRHYFAQIRQDGYFVSVEEVEPNTVGIAAPVSLPETGVVASLSLILTRQRLEQVNPDGLAQLVSRRARAIGGALLALSLPVPAESAPVAPTNDAPTTEAAH